MFALVILLLVVGVATQFVLWTNIPRDVVLGQLQKQLGLRVAATSLSSGWLGNTELRDVAIGLPLSDEALLRVPVMRVKHTTLFGMLWQRSVTLQSIQLDEPHIIVRQDDAGRWNIQEVADLLARTGGKETAAEQAKTTSRPKLPAVRIVNGTIEVIDRNARKGLIRPLSVAGEPEAGLTWKYDASAGSSPGTKSAQPNLQLVGRLVPGGTWEHQVNVQADQVQAWAAPWMGSAAAPSVSFTGEWHGRVKGGVAGRLVIGALDVAGVHTTGALSVATENGVLVFRPQDLLVQTGQKAIPELRITTGTLRLDGKSISADALTVLSYGGAARVDASYDWTSASADAKVSWSDFAVPGQEITHGGRLSASLRHPLPGRPVVSVQINSNGKFPFGAWEGELTLGGAGRDWGNMDWELQVRRLGLSGPQPIRLDGLATNIETRGNLISLASLRGPGEVVARGRGQFDLASRAWNLRVDLSNLPPALPVGPQGPLAITLNARGDSKRIVLEPPGLSVRGSEAELRFDGSYVYNVPKPVDFNVFVNHIPPRIESKDQPVFGYLRGEAHITGTAWLPRNLEITGKLIGRDVRFFDRPIGEITAAISGQIDDQRLTLQSERLKLLGGEWRVDALFPQEGALGINLKIGHLPLAEIGAAIKRPQLQGTVDSDWAFIIPRLQAEAVKVSGNVKGRDVRYGALAADQLEATVLVADGSLKVDPARLRKGNGQADVAAELDVREFRRIGASLALNAWPFEPSPGTRAELSGGTTGLRVVLPGAKREEGIRRGIFQLEGRASRFRITGPIDLRAAFTLKERPAGNAHILADLRGRAVDLHTLSYDGLDGNVQGQAMIDFDQISQAKGSLTFKDFNAERIAEFFPDNRALPGLSGRFSGEMNLGPAPGPRPVEPVRITAKIDNQGGRYRSIDVGPVRISAFTNFDRLVIEDSPENPTTIDLAGGLVRIWGRLSVLEPGDELNPTAASQPLYLSQMQVRFGRLDLDQVVHAFKPDADPMIGKLSGSFEALGGPRVLRRPGEPPSEQGLMERFVRRITADGRVELTESDLGNLDVVAFLYNAMSVVGAPSEPQGKGNVGFHLEDGLLSLNNLRYFNRGTEIRAIADVDQVWRMPDSPVWGTAAGTARPFRDIKLPFLSNYDLDTILTVLQTDLTTVSTGGTVLNPVIQPLAFSDLSAGMRRLILGDFDQENTKQRQR